MNQAIIPEGNVRAALPTSVRYVKNRRRGEWWPAAKANDQVHAGWTIVPKAMLEMPDFQKIEKRIKWDFGDSKGATQDFNALRDLLDSPTKRLWITFEDGCMWWCTVLDGATVNPDGQSDSKGHFWLTCDRP